MTPSKILFYFCVSFVTGIGLASFLKIPAVFMRGFLIVAISVVAVSAAFRARTVVVLGFCLLSLALGVARIQAVKLRIANDPLRALNDTSPKITLIGVVFDEPDVRDSFQKLKIKDENTKSIILVSLNNFSEYHYLDTIQITGALKAPGVTEDFNYKNYLAKEGIYSVMDYPEAKLISDKHSYNAHSFLYEKILFLKNRLMNVLDTNLSPPGSDLLKGVVFGNDKGISKDLKNGFNVTGLSHVTAVSGSNVVIVISVTMVLFLALGFWRRQAFYAAIILIWVYIVLIGAPASGVRAAIMGSLALLATNLGRQSTSSRTIALAAGAMLLQNPFLLFYDAGFQLSFLAAMGIIYLKPLIDNALRFNSSRYIGHPARYNDQKRKSALKDKLKVLSDIISVTFAAQIFTLPIIVYNFGKVSLVAPITNVLILPIVPLLTILGLLASILGAASRILGFIISVPCWFLLTYFLKVVDIFYQPWAVATISRVSWFWLALYYAFLALAIRHFNKKLKPKFLGS